MYVGHDTFQIVCVPFVILLMCLTEEDEIDGQDLKHALKYKNCVTFSRNETLRKESTWENKA